MTSHIYTGRGDRGVTTLATGAAVSKSSLRLEAYGTVDETTAVLGVVLAQLEEGAMRRILAFVSHRLFNCSAILAGASSSQVSGITVQDVHCLEQHIDAFDEQCPPITGFVLCGGTVLAADCHVARAVMRRAERALVRLSETEAVDGDMLRFVNRVSDLLFVCARLVNYRARVDDLLWVSDARRPECLKG